MEGIQEFIKQNDFSALQIKLASPEEILSWSHGEVTKAETINYRTQKPEKDGLFSEQIFGPVKDYECACGKYKGIRYKGIVCDRCGVEVTSSSVRRERMGHIKLAAPVAHIWFLRSVPSRIALALNVPFNHLEGVIYYNNYIITSVDEAAKEQALKNIEREYKTKLQSWPQDKRNELTQTRDKALAELSAIKVKSILTEINYLQLSKKFGNIFTAATGSEPVLKFLQELDLEKEVQSLKEQVKKNTNNKKVHERLKLLQSFIKSHTRPEWMFLTILPVLPPDLRPMVQLEGGKFATSDLNDLYRRVINRNNRLKKLLDLKAPEVIIKNEKRMLQEAVDALLDNSMRKGSTTPMRSSQHRPLRSLADILRGKQGRFRRNLLGKRVDYSGRSVIVIGPTLKIDECGVPKKMALELFRPFVIRELIKREIVFNPHAANKLIDEGEDIVWAILEEVVQGKYILLNRAPTLHRLSIEAFKPKLVEGLALHVPALICQPFNADFDGDQMAIHYPLSEEAQWESKTRMSSLMGLLKPANGEPMMTPRHEMVLGVYWLTMDPPQVLPLEQRKIFASPDEALLARDYNKIGLQEIIRVRFPKSYRKYNGERDKDGLVSTTVGRIIFNNILPDDLEFINRPLKSKDLKEITQKIDYKYSGFQKAQDVLDKIKNLGFKYATKSGVSWGIADLKIPAQKKDIIEKTSQEAKKIENEYQEGLLTLKEKKTLIEAEWKKATDEIANLVPHVLTPWDSVSLIFDSGARGNWAVGSQIMGMKGLVVNPMGQLIEMPIVSSHQEGFNVLEYFAASHGGRKGLADTALKTSKAGYLTRRLVDVSQDIIIQEEDCGTKKGLTITKDYVKEIGETFEEAIFGRYLAKNVTTTKGKVIAKRNELIDEELAKKLAQSVDEVVVRSPLTCESKDGVCQKCYGLDLAWKKPIDLGEAVGVIAAQSIGEPGTQLTLRTFHSGGVARAVDITQGLPRVEEILEARTPRGEAPISIEDGVVEEIEKIKHQKMIRIRSPKGHLAEYVVPELTTLLVKQGQKVKKGQQLSEGSLDLKKLLKISGKDACQQYILKEVKKVYDLAGEKINDKHFEIIIRKMFSKMEIIDPGDSDYIKREIVDIQELEKLKKQLKDNNKKPPQARQLVMGIKNVALNSSSFLSAASFQETSRVLIQAAIEGKIDYLRGLKENVIIGRLIPAGTGFRK